MKPGTRRITLRVLQAQTGDRAAFNELLQEVQEPLFRHLKGIVSDSSTAEDLLQDVLVLIYRKLRWLRTPELFLPWCFRITTREAFKRLKRERRWSAQVRDPEVLEGVPEPERDNAPEPETLEGLEKALHWLSPGSRAVFSLHYLNELSLQETAAVLGLPMGTVKSRLAYGLAVIRQKLKKGDCDE